MFSLIRYMVVFVVGSGFGYWFGTSQNVPVTMEPPVKPTTVASPTIAAMPTANSPITTVPSATKQTTQPKTPSFDVDPAEILALELQAAHQKTPEDPVWQEYLQQHYDEHTQRLLNRQTAKNQQLIREFHQSEVDPHWANLTEQRLKDYYFLQPDQQFIQISKVHCRQNGCEVSGVITKSDLGPMLRENLRQQPWTKGRSISFSRSSSEGEEKFYLLMTELPKE
ncbi:hypothetical protein EOE67_07495 [Rheinheimera riviphila]|uniref:Uncharacterized protein n=1 Tax=Rheinheimera riviphila TaxID=1834037 RepID=A0A437R001_9GAMM|nr:hypothetical protein [Rheinheimera riviphila]RVU40088.1 hypothetical protein EOE67_07495 [Rheinheimera riviphila]